MAGEADDKFTWGAGDVVVTQCTLCKHRGTLDPWQCAAFPAGIPDKIRTNNYDHRKPWIDPRTGEPGDEGIPLDGSITFEPADGVSEETLAALYRHLDKAVHH